MSPMTKSRRFVLVLAASFVVFAAAILGGCAPSNDFEVVDAVRSDLQLEGFGRIESEVHYGQSGAVEEGGPAVELLVTSRESSRSILEGRLGDMGFADAGIDSWRRESPYTLVQFGDRSGGTKYTPPGGPSVIVPSGGGLVVVISS